MVFSTEEFEALESNLTLLVECIADAGMPDLLAPDEELPSEALSGFRWAFENLSYQVSRALFTSTGDLIQLNQWKVRLEQLLEDATTVSALLSMKRSHLSVHPTEPEGVLGRRVPCSGDQCGSHG